SSFTRVRLRSWSRLSRSASRRKLPRPQTREVPPVKALATIYRYWMTLFFLAVVAQIAGAAYGAFYTAQKLGDQKGPDEQKVISEKVFDHGFGLHIAFGFIIFLGALVLLLLPLAVRLGGRR